MQEHNWTHEAPELAAHQNSYPEVYHPVPTPEVVQQYQYGGNNCRSVPLNSYTAPATATATATTATEASKDQYHGGGGSSYSPYDQHSAQGILSPTGQTRERPRRTICGRAMDTVFFLSVATALLSLAVIGLAAGTGIQSKRANDADAKLAALVAKISNLDRGCSEDPGGVSSSSYISDFFNRRTFKIYCNSDAPNPPLQTLFVGNFDDCIDACASYSTFTAGNFPGIKSDANFTCSGVSFIPAWTNRTYALKENAPGNCYLKPGPQNVTALTHPNADSDTVHAAILVSPE
ncbi:hypothetical protein F5Y17DRAFT_468978 [Xylariaceae sp. FL0594]|nr:hypothetical protein F5Y17DRAFT_468978 [Xylariaceae sp. FL0594]